MLRSKTGSNKRLTEYHASIGRPSRFGTYLGRDGTGLIDSKLLRTEHSADTSGLVERISDVKIAVIVFFDI